VRRSLVQRSPIECGVSGCDLETSAMRRTRLVWDVEPYKIYILIHNSVMSVRS